MQRKPTIRDRTRAILGWDESLPSRAHPYRIRRCSGSSTCSSDYSHPSPCTSTSSGMSPNPQKQDTEQRARDAHVFERLRQLVPILPSDRNVFQLLIDSVSQVMELEEQLERLEEKANDFRRCALQLDATEANVPKDLENIDVSEFKHLVYSQPIHFDPKLFL